MANKYWQNKIRLKEAYEAGHKSALNENVIKKLAARAAEYFDVPKITLGQELEDYLRSLNLLKATSVRKANRKYPSKAPPSLKIRRQQKYLGTAKDFVNPLYRRRSDQQLTQKTLDRRKLAYDRARLQPLPDPSLEQKYQDMLAASDVVGEVDLTNLPLTPENMELIRYILARRSGTLDNPIRPSPRH